MSTYFAKVETKHWQEILSLNWAREFDEWKTFDCFFIIFVEMLNTFSHYFLLRDICSHIKIWFTISGRAAKFL